MRAAVLACSVCVVGACSVVPGAERSGAASFPPPDAWPERRAADGALPTSMLIEGVTDEGEFGLGHIFRLDVPVEPGWEASSMIFRSDTQVGFSLPLTITWEDRSWFVPGATTTLMLREVRRADLEVQGTCIYLSSLVGISDPEQALVSELLFRGWRLLKVWPSIETYAEALYAFPTDSDVDQSATTIAKGADSYLAGTAYGVEALLRWAEQRHPDLQDHPVVVVGSSLGAISTPTVVARLRSTGASRVDGAVLIGGGAGLLDITAHSPVMRDRFKIRSMERANDGSDRMVMGAADPERMHTLLDKAQGFSRLDPGVTAGALLDIPVLQLHASFDEIVPARTGESLWEKLGRPERWDYPTGHTGLFLLLPYEADDIARWLDTNVLRADREGTRP